ncbi:MAG TPA: hypothetical protein VD859_15910 [Nocardioides sp.]|nr:hypothetical protein [Nocardioides sp.]
MYGDTEVIRRRIDQLREQGVEIRALADQLVARTEALQWSGRAATAMRERVAERAAHLRSAADRHEGAADLLARHAQDVDVVKEEIAAVEQRVAGLVADARSRVAAIVAENETNPAGPRVTPDPDDEVVAGFVPLAPGHKGWLSVELPGL